MDSTVTWAVGIIIASVLLLVLAIWASIVEKKREKKRREQIMSFAHMWSPHICNLLIDKQIELGMTVEMVFLSWGKPTYQDQHETNSRSEKFRWIYGTPRRGAKYVWFSNDKVVKIKT